MSENILIFLNPTKLLSDEEKKLTEGATKEDMILKKIAQVDIKRYEVPKNVSIDQNSIEDALVLIISD